MTLIPTGGLIGAIAKLEATSPRAARALVTMGLYESLADQAEEMRDVLEPLVVDRLEQIAKDARVALLRTGVSKADEATLAAADGLATIGKAFWNRKDRDFKESEVRRDSKGRFAKIPLQGIDPNVARQAPGLSRSSRGREAKTKAMEYLRSGLITETTPIHLHTQRRGPDGKPGSEHGAPVQTTLKDLDETLAQMPDDVELAGLSIARRDFEGMNPRQQAALDVVGMFSGQDLPGTKRVMNGLPLDDKGHALSGNATASNWNAPSAGGTEQDRQGYRRLKITGQALQRMSAPGSTGSVAGGLAELIGEMGPEAEKVLGPGIRRAAYRYRGTERRPETLLREQIGVAQATAFSGEAAERGNPASAIGSHWQGRGSNDQRRLSAAGDAAVAHFLGTAGNTSAIPDRELAELSMESGEVPPSQGVIIDAQGRVVSQAVGFNGDHYLPFDLRNLNELHGGQYVRTRALGGPTTEDIYTGLLTGARQVQVVSNSGVFTLEFDPTLRGGRRYSDKARRMVTRYQQMLEAIAAPDSKMFERDLPAQDLAEIRRRASEAADSEQEYQTLVARGIEQARVKAGFGSDDDDDARQKAAEHRADTRMRQEINPRDHSPRQLARMREDFISEELQSSGDGGVRRLRLDGAGYDRALRALKQEFPYFIRRAGYKSLPDWMRERDLVNPGFGRVGANDRGYVQPGQTNPALGLQGANARRRVGTLRTGRDDTALQTNENGSQQSGAQPAAAKAPVTTGAPKGKPLAQRLLDPSSPVRGQLVRDSAELVAAISQNNPSSSPVQEGTDPLTYSGYPFLQHKMAEIARNNRGNEGKTFMEWFLKATPQEKSLALSGMESAQENFAYWDSSDKFDQQVAPAIERFKHTMTLLEPFAEPPKGEADWMTVEPDEHDARPFMMDGIPEVGSDDEVFAKTRAKLELGGDKMNLALADFEGMPPDERAEEVRRLAALVTEKESANLDSKSSRAELLAARTAWAFHHAREVSAELRKLMGSGGGAAPFGKAASRRLIVHKTHEPFSRHMRALMGVPEPSRASA